MGRRDHLQEELLCRLALLMQDRLQQVLLPLHLVDLRRVSQEKRIAGENLADKSTQSAAQVHRDGHRSAGYMQWQHTVHEARRAF